jgi:hypothetical protein
MHVNEIPRVPLGDVKSKERPGLGVIKLAICLKRLSRVLTFFAKVHYDNKRNLRGILFESKR